MFRGIEIQMAGPICSCDVANVGWSIWFDENNRSGLKLSCKDCGTTLMVPNKKFLAHFKWDKSYPGGSNKKADVIPLTLHKGGKEEE